MPKLIQLGSTMPANETPYAIFKDRMQMVNTIVQNYKRYQEKKWDAEWQQAAVMDMTQEQKTPQTDYLLNNTNPSEKDIDIEGATKFAEQAIGSMTMHEKMMGVAPEGSMTQHEQMMGVSQPETATSTMPQISQNSTQNEPITKNTNNEPQKQLIPDEMEFNELLKFVSELPTGRVDWSNTLEVFNKRLEKGRALGDAATQVLNTILNQGKVDQRAELKQNVELASYLKDTMYPEEEQEGLPSTEMELFLRYPDLYSQYKEAGRTPKTPTEWDKKFDIIMQLEPTKDELKKFLGVYITPEKQSDFDKRFDILMQTNPSTDEVKKFLGGYITPKDEDPDTDKLTPTYSTIQSINEDLLDPTKNYDRVLAQAGVKYDLSDPNINFATKDDRAKKMYDFALTGDEKTYGLRDADIVDEDGFVKDEGEYNLLYQEYEKGAKEYYEATGQVLPKEFLSPEEAGKYTGLTIGKGYKGGLKPVKNTENIPWRWAGEDMSRGRDKYGYVIGETKEIDGVTYEYIGDDKWESKS